MFVLMMCCKSFSVLQAEEKKQEYSSLNPLRERLLHNNLAEFVSSRPQLSSTIANREKATSTSDHWPRTPPKKICARRGSDTSSRVLPPRKSCNFHRLKRVFTSNSSLPSKKQRVEARPCTSKQPAFLGISEANLEVSDTVFGVLSYPMSAVISAIRKFWVQKHCEKLQGLEDSEVKNGALSNMVKAIVYTIEDNDRSSKLLSKTEELVDENAKLLEKVGEMQDELSILNNLKFEMQTRLNRRREEAEKAKKEATKAIENFKETKEYRTLRKELYHQGTDAVIESITSARPDYDLSFLYSSREDENEDEISTDEDLKDWRTAKNC
ncbi:Uncharacterized protein Adt_47137 [Abeliophyllum distichum]|uniref:Uncharacterized protein n=1 Tax=Abeliophyllum distichum TaxID=126358 RepID=A0ABD1NVT4_9LAMI